MSETPTATKRSSGLFFRAALSKIKLPPVMSRSKTTHARLAAAKESSIVEEAAAIEATVAAVPEEEPEAGIVDVGGESILIRSQTLPANASPGVSPVEEKAVLLVEEEASTVPEEKVASENVAEARQPQANSDTQDSPDSRENDVKQNDTEQAPEVVGEMDQAAPAAEQESVATPLMQPPPQDSVQVSTPASPEPVEAKEIDDDMDSILVGVDKANKGAPSIAETYRSKDSRAMAVSLALENFITDIERIKNNDPEMTRLTLGSSHALTPANASALLAALPDNTTLQHLDLPNSRLQNKFAVELAGVLGRNQGLVSVNLDGNAIGPQGVKALAQALKGNSTLRELRLGNQLALAGSEAEAALADAIQRNTSLVKLAFVFRDVAARNTVDNALTRNNNAYRGRS
ncbi:hypothetical protein BC830DRAFT_1089324 [Chytriomyces sp. MP71]|nr:hypothetical protein BC830DRAFT_1089324 [Chytriomyces sp. MP71]